MAGAERMLNSKALEVEQHLVSIHTLCCHDILHCVAHVFVTTQHDSHAGLVCLAQPCLCLEHVLDVLCAICAIIAVDLQPRQQSVQPSELMLCNTCSWCGCTGCMLSEQDDVSTALLRISLVPMCLQHARVQPQLARHGDAEHHHNHHLNDLHTRLLPGRNAVSKGCVACTQHSQGSGVQTTHILLAC